MHNIVYNFNLFILFKQNFTFRISTKNWLFPRILPYHKYYTTYYKIHQIHITRISYPWFTEY